MELNWLIFFFQIYCSNFFRNIKVSESLVLPSLNQRCVGKLICVHVLSDSRFISSSILVLLFSQRLQRKSGRAQTRFRWIFHLSGSRRRRCRRVMGKVTDIYDWNLRGHVSSRNSLLHKLQTPQKIHIPNILQTLKTTDPLKKTTYPPKKTIDLENYRSQKTADPSNYRYQETTYPKNFRAQKN